MQLTVERNLLENLPPVGLERRAEVVNIDAAQLGHEPVRNPGGNAAHPEIIDTIFAPAADNVVTGRNLLQENWNIGGIMLQIAVHGDDVFPARVIKTRSQPRGLAEISPELDHRD